MRRAGDQPTNEGRQVGGVGRRGVVPPIVGPWGRAMMAVIVGNVAVLCDVTLRCGSQKRASEKAPCI
jgi:hypothetical protein